MQLKCNAESCDRQDVTIKHVFVLAIIYNIYIISFLYLKYSQLNLQGKKWQNGVSNDITIMDYLFETNTAENGRDRSARTF